MRQYLFAAAVGLAGALGVLAVISAVGAYYSRIGVRANVSQSAGFSPLGWVGPLLLGGVVLALGWLLTRPQSPRSDATDGSHATCRACGERVVVDWHICPYCGGELNGATSPGADRSGSDTWT